MLFNWTGLPEITQIAPQQETPVWQNHHIKKYGIACNILLFCSSFQIIFCYLMAINKSFIQSLRVNIFTTPHKTDIKGQAIQLFEFQGLRCWLFFKCHHLIVH